MANTGNDRKVYITTGVAQTTGTWLEGETSNSISRSADTIEISDKGTSWKKFIVGQKSATAEVTVNLDDTSTKEQAKLLASFVAGTSVFVFIGRKGASAFDEGDAFEAVITAVNDTNDSNSVASRTISLQATGEVKHLPANA